MIQLNKVKEWGFLLLSLFIFSFFLNFVWESFHSVFLYEGHNFNAARYIPMIGYVSNIDSMLILGMYVVVALLWKNLSWIKQIKKYQIALFIVLGLIIASFIEYRAIFVLERWSYSSLMPTVFGIGLSPLVQLSATGLLAIWFTRRIQIRKET